MNSLFPILRATSSSSARSTLLTRPFTGSAITRARSKKTTPVNPDAMPIAAAAQVLKALESNRPQNAFELEIQTRHDKSAPPLRGRVSLPRDARTKREIVLVFAEGDAVRLAKAAGADHVGGEELIPQVLSGEISPTKIISLPSLLPTLTPKLGRFLGQKGLMPSVKRGTAREDVDVGVREAKGLLDWREDRWGGVRVAIGRIHFSTQDVESNIKHFIRSVRETQAGNVTENSKPVKGPAILRVSLGSTQGPSIELRDF